MNKRQKQVYDFLTAKNTWMSAKEIAQEIFKDNWTNRYADVGHSLQMLEIQGRLKMRRIPVKGRSDTFEYSVK